MTILLITRRRFWQTLAALRGKVGGTARIIAVLEPRSNTMKMGICKDDLAPSLGRADEVFLLQPAHIPWQVQKWQKPAFSLHTGVAMWIHWQIWW
ncbi:UDP-N-acetylmuramate:L-alanyl-gamma-D-glutamyl-meso-diaminopimelate ligase [Escherichia coli]|uniref:UDP-N-acetylmuramate:L-alanyl-gamma-D-glutamyl-meso-diaminopimelate ligase n=1 Tax=Escherichia coli TaxID=562 RepID=A0A376L1V2_ECOLX|nr:UDP-N-acetylmuramate:L-alanyl-gamma-D-glutamyl-meso-diaminopimelate ligase [Escherichia coli]